MSRLLLRRPWRRRRRLLRLRWLRRLRWLWRLREATAAVVGVERRVRLLHRYRYRLRAPASALPPARPQLPSRPLLAQGLGHDVCLAGAGKARAA